MHGVNDASAIGTDTVENLVSLLNCLLTCGFLRLLIYCNM